MARQDDLKKLIVEHNRRLQILKEQQARQGVSVDPKIPLEIEDIDTEIAKLRAELAALPEIIRQNPYRGLLAFRESDADVFFGRETFTGQLVERVQQQPLVAVLGPSGSGKSSVVLAGLIPALRHHKSQWLISSFRLGNDPFQALAAVLLPLYETDLDKTDQMVKIPKLATYLREKELPLSGVVRNIFEAQPQAERFLLIADQFEELYTLTQDTEIRHRFVVTCRILDYGEELSGLQRVEVQPFNDEQIKALLQKVLPKQWPTLWQVLTDSQDESHRLLEMARNPYVLNMMIYVFAVRGQLNQSRADLMTSFTEILWHWAEKKCPPDEWLDVAVQREALSIMAFEMQDRAGFGTEVETGLVKTIMPGQVQTHPNWPPRPSPPDQVLTLAASANIIEMPEDRSSIRFYHQLLQEYFAAQAMLKQEPNSLAERWRWPWLETEMPLWVQSYINYPDPLPPPPPTGWEETTILAAGLATENDDQLVQALIAVNPVLAGRCLHEGRAKVDGTVWQTAIEALLTTIARPEVALRVRIAAGEVLGYLGDPRLGELATVPGGEFLMGTNRQELKKTGLAWQTWMESETPQHKLFLPAYQMSKYPVTNAEYAPFIEAGGYADKRWWTEAGWREKARGRTEPAYWQADRFNRPNHPVVGVSWYESVAYCRWLRAESDQPYRLPTEAEWEKAARGTEGWIYPWGNEFEASRLNAYQGKQKVRTATPVGIYPTGISPSGAFDCVGNVWEWCATRWKKDYPYNHTEDEWAADYLGGTNERGLRGGSWDHPQYYPRCAWRWFVHPGRLFKDVGFRVACHVTT